MMSPVERRSPWLTALFAVLTITALPYVAAGVIFLVLVSYVLGPFMLILAGALLGLAVIGYGVWALLMGREAGQR